MKVYINGNEIDVLKQLSVEDLIAERCLNPDTIVVEHNLSILPKEKWPEVMLKAEDKLEIVSFVGGG